MGFHYVRDTCGLSVYNADEWDEGKPVLLIIPWIWGGVEGSGEKARGPQQHNVRVAEPP